MLIIDLCRLASAKWVDVFTYSALTSCIRISSITKMIRNLITLQRSIKCFCFGCMFSVVEKKLFIEFACNAFFKGLLCDEYTILKFSCPTFLQSADGCFCNNVDVRLVTAKCLFDVTKVVS